MKSHIRIFAVLSTIAAFVACGTLDLDTNQMETYTLELPDEPYSYEFGSDVSTLGRVLFYDKSLSINSSTSCGTCHIQSLAFSDGKALSKGFQNQVLPRNTPSIQNLSHALFEEGNSNNTNHGNLFWDGRAKHLVDMVIMPVLHPVEMGFFSKEDLVKRVNSKSYYRTLFQEAFGHDSATVDEIAIALASFIANFEPRNTKSSGLENNLSAARGEELFVEVYRCDRCHRVGVPDGYLFGGSSFNGFSDIGLENNSGDKGLGNVTNRASDNGKFKIPSLTNIALTAPYMHDGRFKTLDEVIEHYSIGVKGAENLDPILKDANGDPIKLNITPQDAQDIIAFLHTLTDFNFINDKRFSDPFKPTK